MWDLVAVIRLAAYGQLEVRCVVALGLEFCVQGEYTVLHLTAVECHGQRRSAGYRPLLVAPLTVSVFQLDDDRRIDLLIREHFTDFLQHPRKRFALVFDLDRNVAVIRTLNSLHKLCVCMLRKTACRDIQLCQVVGLDVIGLNQFTQIRPVFIRLTRPELAAIISTAAKIQPRNLPITVARERQCVGNHAVIVRLRFRPPALVLLVHIVDDGICRLLFGCLDRCDAILRERIAERDLDGSTLAVTQLELQYALACRQIQIICQHRILIHEVDVFHRVRRSRLDHRRRNRLRDRAAVIQDQRIEIVDAVLFDLERTLVTPVFACILIPDQVRIQRIGRRAEPQLQTLQFAQLVILVVIDLTPHVHFQRCHAVVAEIAQLRRCADILEDLGNVFRSFRFCQTVRDLQFRFHDFRYRVADLHLQTELQIDRLVKLRIQRHECTVDVHICQRIVTAGGEGGDALVVDTVSGRRSKVDSHVLTVVTKEYALDLMDLEIITFELQLQLFRPLGICRPPMLAVFHCIIPRQRADRHTGYLDLDDLVVFEQIVDAIDPDASQLMVTRTAERNALDIGTCHQRILALDIVICLPQTSLIAAAHNKFFLTGALCRIDD